MLSVNGILALEFLKQGRPFWFVLTVNLKESDECHDAAYVEHISLFNTDEIPILLKNKDGMMLNVTSSNSKTDQSINQNHNEGTFIGFSWN